MFQRYTKQSFFLVCTILVVAAFLVRIYKITNPIADWHSFRQADTASVTREFVKHGVDFLHPKYQDLSNIQSGENNNGKDNVEGWRMVEFPIVNGLLAYLLRALPFLSLIIVSRLASVIASLFSLIFLILIVRRIYGERLALITGFFFSFLPYSIYYSRAILPEPFFIALSLGSIYCYQKFVDRKSWSWVWLSAALFALALLIKPMAVFFVPVFFGVRFFEAFNLKLTDIASAFVFALSVIPLLLWRRWILQYPIGIPISSWLYNGVGKGTNLLPVYKIRFKPAWWRWIFYERLTKLFLGYFGTITFAVGTLTAFFVPTAKRKSNLIFFLGWLVGSFLYISVFAAGNVQHDYYQAPLVPFVSITLALGTAFIFIFFSKWNKKLALAVCALLISVSFIFAWRIVGGYYQINHWDIIEAGNWADKHLPQNAKVIAPYGGDTAFLFATNRTGWPIGFDIATKITEGAGYYITTSYDDEANALRKKYATLEANKDFLVLDLTQKLN